MSERTLRSRFLWTGLAKVGPDRWLWCAHDWKELKYPLPDPVFGYVATKEAGLRAILDATGAPGFMRDRGDEDDEDRLVHPRVMIATEWRHKMAERRRKPNPKAAPHAQATEYVYHHERSLSDYDSSYDCSTCAHRILKRTAKYIYAVRDCNYRADREDWLHAMRLDRAKLEAGEHASYRRGRGWSSKYFTFDKQPPWEKWEGEVPECFAALGLQPPVTQRQVKRAFRKLAHSTHPDRGGNAEAFRNLQEQYEQALAMASR
jgi:hypothetical protein